jgi:hypothetical protein
LSARLRLQLRPSYALAAVIVSAHAAAAGSVLFLMRDAWGVLLAAALLALGGASAWSRALLRGRAAVRVLELFGDERAGAARRRYVSRFLVTLPLGGRTLLVSADMLEPHEFRRLRIWALWGKLPAVAGAQLVG